MKRLSHLTLASALLLGVATSARAHDNTRDPSACGNDNYAGGPTPTLICDAGGPYAVDLASPFVTVQMDGTGSTGAQNYVWNVTYPGAYFDDASLQNPTLLIPVSGTCGFDVEVCLLVKTLDVWSTCCTNVRVGERVAPVIVCPDTDKVISGMSTSPAVLGSATATDNCDQNVTVTHTDVIIQPACPADRFAYVIERTWRATDDDGNVSTCVQYIDVVRAFAHLDVLPGACPNLYNRRLRGTLPIAIVGAPGFDVTQIQWNTVRLFGRDCSAGPILPTSMANGDVATPFVNSLDCHCTTANGDGTLDLVAQFSYSQINTAFNLVQANKGETFVVVVTGELTNGVRFIAQDCFTIH